MAESMEHPPEQWRNFSTKVPISAFRLNRGDLKRLYQMINDKQIEYGNRIISTLKKELQETDNDFALRKQKIQDAFITSVSVTGLNGEMLHGNSAAFLESANIPDRLRSVFISTKTIPKAVLNLNFDPMCNIVVFLDFSQPPIFDFDRLPTLPTPNGSNFEVAADNESWFTAINTKLTQFFVERKTQSNWPSTTCFYCFSAFPSLFG
jgi:hypothetical protein